MGAHLAWEAPNKRLESFRGYLRVTAPKSEASTDSYTALQLENVLLRGCVLKNTDYIYGMCGPHVLMRPLFASFVIATAATRCRFGRVHG